MAVERAILVHVHRIGSARGAGRSEHVLEILREWVSKLDQLPTKLGT